MSSIINHPLAQALAWALVHFVWQGAAIALAALAVMRIARLSASARYVTGVVAMAAMLIAPAITFAWLTRVVSPPVAPASFARESVASTEAALGAPPPASARQDLAAPVAARPAPAPGAQNSATASIAPTVILVLWSAGVVTLSLRLIGGWFVARRLARRSTQPATPEIQALARRIAGRLALDRIVGVFESSAVSVPVMMGWMKPVVLLPAAALSGLSTVQIEALLAHELAHVRRHDYLVNLLQSVVETLLFYHPAVWWVSRRMRVDRELCCDDVALEVCDRIVYATALSELAAMTTTPRLALAATDGPLLNRVRRILGQPAERQDSGSGWLSALLVVLLVGSIAPSALTSTSKPQTSGVAGGVQSGVAGGVQSGVVGGVQSGVAGGVQPGVVGGVQSGTKGGVAPGVLGGVKGGVSPGVVGGIQGTGRSGRPQEVKPDTAQADGARKAEQAAVARANEIELERHQIEMARIENEIRHTQDQSSAKIAGLESDLKVLQQQLNRAKQLVEKGLADSIALAELEAKVTRAVQAITAEKDEAEYLQQTLMLKRREMELDREAILQRRAMAASARDAEATQAKAEVEKAQLRDAVAKMDENQKAQAAAAKAGLVTAEQLRVEDKKRVEAASTVVTSPTEAARAGDILGITIHSEPDLPHNFVVQADGTIRFPFIGAIRVIGLTAKQAQDLLARQLADRKLATGSGIDVTLRRPKTPGAGR